MSARIYVPFMLFNMRAVNLQHLWTPSNEYMGKPTQKPNFFATCILDRTQQDWWNEPALAPAVAAYTELVQKSGMQWGQIATWPIKDGNMPAEPGKPPADWAKNRWIISGSSSNAIKVEIVRPSGSVELLPAKVGVKPGDYVALGLSAAIKQNDARGVKNYMNAMTFMAACPADQEISVGQSVTGTEMMAHAQRQGLQVQGFAPSTGGYAPQQQFQPQGAPQPGFTSHGMPPNAGGFAPTQGGPAGPGYASPPNGGPAFAGGPANGSAYHSEPQQPGPGGYAPPNGAPQFQPQGAPQTFQPPQGGYAPQPGPGQAPGQQQWAPPPNFAPGGPR